MRSARGLVGLFAVCVSMTAAAWGQEAEPRVKIELGKELLTALPERVYGVKTSPDGRVWYQLRQTGKAPDIDEVQDQVEREWNDASPQLVGATPVLFEPTADGKLARAWFMVMTQGGGGPGGSRAMLVGYDGKNWVERALTQGVYYGDYHPGVATADGVFFAGRGSVLIYRDKKWTTQEFVTDAGPNSYVPAPRLFAEPDGRGVVATLYRSGSSNTGLEMWRCREGAWTKMSLGQTPPRSDLASMAFGKSGIWICLRGNSAAAGLCYMPYEAAASEPAATVPAEAPAEQKAALPRSGRVTYSGRAAASDPFGGLTPVSSVGEYGISSVTGLVALSDGRAVLTGRITDPTTGRGRLGLLMLDRDGTWRKVEGAGDWQPGFPQGPNGGAGVVVDGGQKAWLPGSGYDTGPALVDLVNAKVVLRAPWIGGGTLLAATNDGRAFFRNHGGSVISVDPASSDTRTVLKAIDLPAGLERLKGLNWAIDDAGRLWLVSGAKVMRYDGKAWETLLDGDVPAGAGLVVGKGGVAICGTKLITKEKTVTAATLEDLLATNADVVRAAFRGPRPVRLGGPGPFVHADKAGNIWLLASPLAGTVKVYIKDGWVDAGKAMRDGGSHTGAGIFMAGVGDAHVLIMDSNPYDSKAIATLGTMADGKLSFKPLPRCEADRAGMVTAYDGAGGLWLGCHEIYDGGGYSTIPMRVDPSGAVEKFKGNQVRFADRAGNVWLRAATGKGRPENRIAIWHEGQIVDGPAFGGAQAYELPMAEDKPGSVWAVGAVGLVHLKGDPAKPETLRVEGTYRVEEMAQGRLLIDASPLGFMVVAKLSMTGSYEMRMVGVPK